MSMKDFRERITSAWKRTPAHVTVSRIRDVSDMGTGPQGAGPQDEYGLQIGVKRGETGDDLVIKSRTGAIIFSYGKHAEELTDDDLELCGAIPQRENPRMRCKSCGRFSVHINRGLGLCRDCTFQVLSIRGYAFGAPLDDRTRRRSAF